MQTQHENSHSPLKGATFTRLVDLLSGGPYIPPPYSYGTVQQVMRFTSDPYVLLSNFGLPSDQRILRFYTDQSPQSIQLSMERMRSALQKAFETVARDTQTEINERRLWVYQTKLDNGQSIQQRNNVFCRIDSIAFELTSGLVPEWIALLDRFVLASDALVWLELQEPHPPALSLSQGVTSLWDIRTKQILENRNKRIQDLIDHLGLVADLNFGTVLDNTNKKALQHSNSNSKTGGPPRDTRALRTPCFSMMGRRAHWERRKRRTL